MEVTILTIAKAAGLIRARELSSLELTRACLTRIEEHNSRLNAFVTVMDEAAIARAREADEEIARGEWRGPLHGIPIALKDLIDTAGVRTTAGSALFAERIPSQDAEVVRRLNGAGAVIIGKTNLHEFAYGGSSMVSHFGPVRNPLDPEYIAGGSSGGSAAAVASGMCLGAIGTDTAGSIRLPAAYCGIVGLKPTYGMVSADGVIPLAWSYDHVGPMAKTAEDAAILLSVIARREIPTLARPLRGAGGTWGTKEMWGTVEKIRVGVARKFFEGVDAEIVTAVEGAVRKLSGVVAEVRDVSFVVDGDRTASNYESYLYHRKWARESPELYQSSTLARIKAGEKITQAEYESAKARLGETRESAARLFGEVDVVITPTTPVGPAKIAELEADIDNLRAREVVMLRNTRPFNVLGAPAISVPCGTMKNGMPIGVQIAAKPGREDLAMAVGTLIGRLRDRAIG